MTVITINLTDRVVSESAARKPSYKLAKVNGVATLVINSEKKVELNTILGHLKKAKTAGITSAKNLNAWTVTRAKAKSQTGDQKSKTLAKAADFKTKGSAALKEAKQHLKESASYARAHGLSGLKMSITNETIRGITERSMFVQRNLRTAKLNEFGVTRKRGSFKPKFLAADKFEALGAKKAPAAKKAAPAKASAKKESSLWAHAHKPNTHTPGGTQYKTEGQLNDAANQSLRKQSMDWDKQNRMAKRMLKELNGGKAITASAGWSGRVTKTGATFTNKRGQKIVVKAADLKRHGLTTDNLDRSLGEIDIARSTSAPYARPKAAIKVDGHMRSAFNRLVHDKIKGSLTKQWHYRMYANKITFINESTRKSFTLSADDLKSDGITSREAAAVAREMDVKSA